MLEHGGIEAFLKREVLPHATHAWYDATSVKTGYEVSFTRYFYKPKPLRTLEEIRTDISRSRRRPKGSSTRSSVATRQRKRAFRMAVLRWPC